MFDLLRVCFAVTFGLVLFCLLVFGILVAWPLLLLLLFFL